MAFSGALTLTDLNDFIGPSQACIKPVEQINPAPQEDKGAASTEIRVDVNGSYYEVSADGLSGLKNKPSNAGRKLEQAQINLNDCLACSGCITSAESVLITLQSHIEVLNVLDSIAAASEFCDERKTAVISVAPQSLASLAAMLSASSPTQSRVSPQQVLQRIRAFFRQKLGVAHVFDTTFARHLALREHAREFMERSQHAQDSEAHNQHLPMLASACPGWICYAEKAHSEMLPFISKTKSPQQIMGSLVKNWMGKRWGKLPNELYHVAVMPCYDKKLEASRSDFYDELYSTRDVDCVITTGELELMMRERDWDICKPVRDELHTPADSDFVANNTLPDLITHGGSSSGSYLQSIISYVTSTSPTPLFLSVKQIRNADYEEFLLRKESEEVVFKGAKCYGFRNLQNVVRKVGKETGVRGVGAAGRMSGAGRGVAVKRRNGKTTEANSLKDRAYDYVEVMACPGGCVNGGGQLKAPPDVTMDKDVEGHTRDWGDAGVEMQGARWGNKEWTRKVEEAYWENSPVPTGATNGDTRWALVETTRGNAKSDRAIESLVVEVMNSLAGDSTNHLRTQYRAVEDEVVGLAVKW
ncbi:iron hydrogenase [Hymenopellis radicata]|nr:iron hydrogenase [Hymenopellis radicata]